MLWWFLFYFVLFFEELVFDLVLVLSFYFVLLQLLRTNKTVLTKARN